MHLLNNHSYFPPSSWSEGEERTSGCLSQYVQPFDLRNPSQPLPHKSIVFLGFSCDEGVRRNLGRFGSADGPTSLRKVLKKIPWNAIHISIWDAGTICCCDDDLEKAQETIGEMIAALRLAGVFVIILGGGHEVAWGHFQGLIKSNSKQESHSESQDIEILGIDVVNFDAHFDLRPVFANGNGSSGTSFRQIHDYCEENKLRSRYACLGIQPFSNTMDLFTYAKSIETYYALAEEMVYRPHLVHESFNTWLSSAQKIYLTICLDVFAAAYAPGVSSPQALGLAPYTMLPFFKQVLESGKVIGVDIAELNPIYDRDDQTARLAACLIGEILKSHVG